MNKPISPIRAVLVDFGGVLYRTPSPEKVLKVMRFLGRTDPGVTVMQESPMKSKLVWDLMTGQIDEQATWDEMALKWRMSPKLMNFIRKTGYSSKRFDLALANFIYSLRPQYRTAVLTNAGTAFRQTFCEAFVLDKYVDTVIISAEEKLCKPVEDFYRLAVQRLGVEPQEAIFVDDMEENVEGAQKAGLNAFLYKSGPDTINRIQQIINEKAPRFA